MFPESRTKQQKAKTCTQTSAPNVPMLLYAHWINIEGSAPIRWSVLEVKIPSLAVAG